MKKDVVPILIPITQEALFFELRKIVREELTALIGSDVSVDEVLGMTHKPLYDMTEVRTLFENVSRSTIYEWVKAGLLRKKKMKGKVYFLWEDIHALLQRQG